MPKLIYCNGDSFTWGTGIGNLFYEPTKNFDLFEQARESSVWPGQLAELLECDCVNDAWAGGSNSRIVRKTKTYLQDKNPDDVSVFIGWSTALRTEYFRPSVDTDWYEPYRKQGRTGPFDVTPKGTYVQMHTSGLTSPTYTSKYDQAYIKNFFTKHTDADLLVTFMEQVIDIQNFLTENKFQYLMFNTFGIKELFKENVQDRRLYPLIDKMDFDKYMGWPDEDFCVWSYMELGDDQLKDGHLGVASHKHMAVLLNDKFKELYG